MWSYGMRKKRWDMKLHNNAKENKTIKDCFQMHVLENGDKQKMLFFGV